jgi:hypothetical protein
MEPIRVQAGEEEEEEEEFVAYPHRDLSTPPRYACLRTTDRATASSPPSKMSSCPDLVRCSPSRGGTQANVPPLHESSNRMLLPRQRRAHPPIWVSVLNPGGAYFGASDGYVLCLAPEAHSRAIILGRVASGMDRGDNSIRPEGYLKPHPRRTPSTLYNRHHLCWRPWGYAVGPISMRHQAM